MTETIDTTQALNFETAFARLEDILEKMNTGALSLEDSLRHYEEADKLIQFCQKQLSQAETKIEMLVKNREGDLMLSDTNNPITQPFSPSSNSRLD